MHTTSLKFMALWCAQVVYITNPKSHVKEPYTQKWITILSSLHALDHWATVPWDHLGTEPERENDVCRGYGCHQRRLPILSPPTPGLGPQALPWVSYGSLVAEAQEAVATWSRSNNGTQHLRPRRFKERHQTNQWIKTDKIQGIWEFLVLNRLGSLTNACVSSFLH